MTHPRKLKGARRSSALRVRPDLNGPQHSVSLVIGNDAVAVKSVWNREGQHGFKVSWTTKVAPSQLVRLCPKVERARLETDVIVSDSGEPEKMTLVAFEDQGAKWDQSRLVRFNTPYWSLTMWRDGKNWTCDFVGERLDGALEEILKASAAPPIARRAPDVAAKVGTFVRSQRRQYGEVSEDVSAVAEELDDVSVLG